MLNPCSAIEILSLVYISIILGSILSKWKNTEISTRLFALNIILTIIGTICDAISNGYPNLPVKVDVVLLFITCLIGNALIIVFAYYSMYQANAKSQIIAPWLPRTIAVLNGISIVMITIAFFTGTLFPLTEKSYTLGLPGYIMYGLELAATLIILIVLIINKRKIATRAFVGLMALILTPNIGIIIELLIPGAYVSYAALSVSVLIQYVLIQSRLISEAEMRNRIESEVSRTDVMTNLPNRRAYSEFIDDLTAPVCCGVLFFDVNGLKKVNDTQGHAAGDNLIITFAGLLREKLTTTDIFRISGDEFVAIYLGDNMRVIFEKEKIAVKTAISNNNNIAAMGSSFEESIDIVKLITEAEIDMYEDKHEYYVSNGIDRRRK